MWVQGGEKEQLAKTGFGILASVKEKVFSGVIRPTSNPFLGNNKRMVMDNNILWEMQYSFVKGNPKRLSVTRVHRVNRFVFTVWSNWLIRRCSIRQDETEQDQMRRDAKSADLWPSHTPHILTGKPKVYTIHIFEITFPELSMSCVSCCLWAALCPVSWCCLWGAAETLECSGSGSGL